MKGPIEWVPFFVTTLACSFPFSPLRGTLNFA